MRITPKIFEEMCLTSEAVGVVIAQIFNIWSFRQRPVSFVANLACKAGYCTALGVDYRLVITVQELLDDASDPH